MATTASYGFLIPANGDSGLAFFQAMQFNSQQLNDHNHDGVNSAKLTGPASAVVLTQAVSSASWGSALTDGQYRQLITLPTGYTFDNLSIEVRITSTMEVAYPKILKNSSTSFYVYTNDNSIGYTLLYSS